MTITREELKDLYENNTNEFVCTKLGISEPTLLRYLDKCKISRKGKGGGMVQESNTKVKIRVV